MPSSATLGGPSSTFGTGNSGQPQATRGPKFHATQGWAKSHSWQGSRGIWSHSGSIPMVALTGSSPLSDRRSSPFVPVPTGGFASAGNTTMVNSNETALNLTGNASATTLSNAALNNTSSQVSVSTLNATSSTSLSGNATFQNTMSINSSSHNATNFRSPLTNLTMSGSSANRSSIRNLTATQPASASMPFRTSMSTNATFPNGTLTSSVPSSTWYIEVGNSSIAVNFQPMHPTLRMVGGVKGLALITAQQTFNCSSTVTKNIQVLTETFTETVLVPEYVILSDGAPTPLPVLISPPPACATVDLPFNLHQPGGSTTTSTLLVTKKSPVVIRAPQTVGPIYNVPTTSATPLPAQPAAENSSPGAENAQQTAKVETPGGTNGKSQSNTGNSEPDSGNNDKSPGSAPLQQVFPEVVSSSPSAPEVQNSPQAASGENQKQSSTNGNQQPNNNVQQPGSGSTVDGGNGSGNSGQPSQNEQTSKNGGSTSSEQQNSGNTNSPSAGGQTNDEGVSTPKTKQGSDGSEQTSNESQKPKDEGQMPSGGQTSESDTTPNGGETASGIEQDSSNSGSYSGSQNSASQSSSGTADSNGNAHGSSDINSGAADSPAGSDQSNGLSSGVASGNFGESSQDLDGSQGAPTSVTIDNVPVVIGNSAVVVGSQTVNLNPGATTVIANGQPIVIDSSQIVAPGTTVPFEAAITSPPTMSTTIRGVPVVLQPSNIMIGSQTFTHGSSAAFAVYNGQTYSWDAKQLIGPGGKMITFPSATANAPRVTAGGQVFSVYSSTLKASGTNIAIPKTSTASPFTYQGQTFSVNPSQLIVPEKSITVPPATQPTPFVYNGQTFSVDSSQFIAPSATLPLSSGSGTVRYGTQVITVDQTRITCPSTTITLSSVPEYDSTVTPAAITTGGLTFSIGPQAAVIASSTYSFLPGQTPATVTSLGQTVTLQSTGLHFSNVDVPRPTNPPSYSAVTQGDLTFSVAPSAVVVGGQIDEISPSMTPIYTVVNGQTISIGSGGVGLASTTILLPSPTSKYAIVTQGDLTFSVAPSEAVVKGSTFAIGPGMPATMVLDHQTVSIGPSGIYFPGSTVDLPSVTSEATQPPVAVSAGGLSFSVGPTDAIIGGSTYAIGNSAKARTIEVGSETVVLGTSGVIFPSTTVPPEQTPSAMTIDGLTISADATEAIINGTAYAIGSEAIAKTLVVGSETIGLGTKGIVLPSTTITPWGNETQTSLSSMYGNSATRSSSPAAAATTAPSPPTGLPGTSTEGATNGVHSGAGRRLRPPDLLLLGIILSLLTLGF